MSLQSLATAVFCPQGKLEANFPWNIQTAGKRYAMALFHFAIGSFAIPMLLLLPVFALAAYHPTLLSLVDPVNTIKTFAIVALIGGGLGGLGYYAYTRCLRSRPFDFTRRVRAFSATIIGALLAMNLFALTMHMLEPVFPEVIRWVANLMSTPDGQPKMDFVMGLSTLSFVCGFGLQLRYISSSLRKEGRSLSDSMALNFKSRRGSWYGSTLLHTVWPVLLAYALWQPIGETIVYFMGEAHQPTVDLAKQATGGNFILFALMAAVGAPIFEEIVFRGFLYNIIATSLSRPRAPFAPMTAPTTGWMVGLRAWIVRRRNALNRWGHNFGERVHSVLGRYPALTAIIVSSLLFSVMHLQFAPTTLVLLFVLGCIHAELYRRTGSLYCSILLHAMNNGIEVFKLGMGG